MNFRIAVAFTATLPIVNAELGEIPTGPWSAVLDDIAQSDLLAQLGDELGGKETIDPLRATLRSIAAVFHAAKRRLRCSDVAAIQGVVTLLAL